MRLAVDVHHSRSGLAVLGQVAGHAVGVPDEGVVVPAGDVLAENGGVAALMREALVGDALVVDHASVEAAAADAVVGGELDEVLLVVVELDAVEARVGAAEGALVAIELGPELDAAGLAEEVGGQGVGEKGASGFDAQCLAFLAVGEGEGLLLAQGSLGPDAGIQHLLLGLEIKREDEAGGGGAAACEREHRGRGSEEKQLFHGGSFLGVG